MKVIYIDTSSHLHIKVGLKIDEKEEYLVKDISKDKAQAVLPMLQELLQKYDLKIYEIEAIEVNSGPGSFTGLRVGVSIANTLAAILNIPINGGKAGQLVEPIYE